MGRGRRAVGAGRHAGGAIAATGDDARAAVTQRVAHLGLGSNVGDRRAMLQAAIEDLWAHGVLTLASSSVYETAPVGEVTDQPDFLNACIRAETALEPNALLDACNAVPRALGRRPGGIRHGPRAIDVDILLLDGVTVRTDRLTIPHPALAERRFVLEALAELDPRVALPDGETPAEALARLGGRQAVRRAGEPLELRAGKD